MAEKPDEVPYLYEGQEGNGQGNSDSPSSSLHVTPGRNSNGHGSKDAKTSSNASENGSQNSALLSPVLNPSQANAMNSSIISTLDLGEERIFPGTTTESNHSGSQVTKEENGGNILSSSANSYDQEGSLSSSEDANGPYDTPGPSSSSVGSSSGAVPLAPRDVLSSTPRNPTNPSLTSSQSTLSVPESDTTSRHRSFSDADGPSVVDGDMSGFSFAGGSTIEGGAQLGDDSALNALMEVHSTDSQSQSRPNRRDASFGLDPDVDTQHSIKGQPIIPNLLASPLRAVSSTSSHNHHHHHSRPSQGYDGQEEHGLSHSTASTGAPSTMKTGLENVKTVPSVSATGVPRFLPRRTSRSRSPSVDSADEKSNRRRHRRDSSTSSSEASAPHEMQPQYAPSGSLTIALFSPGLTWRRRSYLLLASVVINIGLPFINGIALGFGEIFARSLIAPWLGFAPAALNINAPAAQRQNNRNTSGVGLRHAGKASNERKSS